ncbi:MAG: DUF6390 family protein [archaeon]
MDGLELAVRFSYITNQLQFCGPSCATEQFLAFVRLKKHPEQVEASLKKFEALYPYLQVIAEKTGKHFTDYDVVEAYWIGNALLEKFTDEDMKDIIRRLVKRGMLASHANYLIEHLPTGLLPHHLANVLYVGVGKVTGSVETTLQNMDNCRPAWGRVLEVLKDKIIVAVQPLKKEKAYFLGEEETRTALYHPDLLAPRVGDVVALHWGFACMILDKKQQQSLQAYTQRLLKVIPTSI